MTLLKFSDGEVCANNVDAVWSESTLFPIPCTSFGCITQRLSRFVQVLG